MTDPLTTHGKTPCSAQDKGPRTEDRSCDCEIEEQGDLVTRGDQLPDKQPDKFGA